MLAGGQGEAVLVCIVFRGLIWQDVSASNVPARPSRGGARKPGTRRAAYAATTGEPSARSTSCREGGSNSHGLAASGFRAKTSTDRLQARPTGRARSVRLFCYIRSQPCTKVVTAWVQTCPIWRVRVPRDGHPGGGQVDGCRRAGATVRTISARPR